MIVSRARTELKIHAALQEELFYPAVRKPVGKEVVNEADEEHHVAKLLIAELDRMDGSESHFDAKFTVLAENVRHHIKEEEDEMLPKAKGRSRGERRTGDGPGRPGSTTTSPSRPLAKRLSRLPSELTARSRSLRR